MELPKELEKGGSPAEAVRRFLSRNKTGARVWPGDEAVREAIRTRPFYKAGRSTQRFQVLRRLEESYCPTEPVDYGKAHLVVEHVLPQRPAQQWFDLLAEEAEDGQSADELHGLLVHTLGNLTLSADNARLSNHPFRRKQQILDSSALRMNQQIAAQQRWGRAEILTRAAELAEKAVQLWPGPIEGMVHADDEWPGWRELRTALLAMPAGTWTSYGDLAALIGTAAISVAGHVASKPGLHCSYRVMTSDGRIAEGFRWADDQHTGDPQVLLEAEGVPFDDKRRADRAHRLTTADLAALVGKDGSEEAPPAARADDESQAATRFETLLRDNQTPETVEGVLTALRFWERQGGRPRIRQGERDQLLPSDHRGQRTRGTGPVADRDLPGDRNRRGGLPASEAPPAVRRRAPAPRADDAAERHRRHRPGRSETRPAPVLPGRGLRREGGRHLRGTGMVPPHRGARDRAPNARRRRSRRPHVKRTATGAAERGDAGPSALGEVRTQFAEKRGQKDEWRSAH
ncbi:DUF1524 domain-containing protein [Streptomyces libani]